MRSSISGSNRTTPSSSTPCLCASRRDRTPPTASHPPNSVPCPAARSRAIMMDVAPQNRGERPVKRDLLISSVLLLLLLTGCATTAVDMAEPRRVVGTESSVRVDAQISGDAVSPGAQIPIQYEITNQREHAIAIAELLPETTYDSDSQTFTVSIGSEVPGNNFLPRLVLIEPGEKKAFNVMARVIHVIPPRGNNANFTPAPAGFRLKLNFLSDTEPFRALIGIKEVAVQDPKLADTLFPLWLERNEVVYTNSIPMRWEARPRGEFGDAPERRAPARRRGSG